MIIRASDPIPDIDGLVDVKVEADQLARVFEPFLSLGFRKGIGQGLLQGSGKYAVEDLFTTAIRLAIKRKAYEHAALAAKTTKDELAKVIAEAIEEGQSTPELANTIRDSFDVQGKFRPLRIARTELTGTINEGTNTTLRAEGYQRKTWSAVIDGRERATHAAANGQTVGIHEAFHVGGESGMFPGDSNFSASNLVNCRCLIIGSGMPEDRATQLGRRFLRIHGSLEYKFVISLRKAFLEQRDRVLSRLP